MAKDPAFLFYSKDWIEGTAEMFPAEKGVYIDLLCYQHQKGDLPTDIERLARLVRLTTNEFMPIWENIRDKFELHDNRLVNRKLDRVMGERSEKGIRNFISGTFASLLRVNKLSRKDYDVIRSEFKIDNFIDKDRERITERLTEWFNLRLKSIENANAIVIENVNENIIEEEKEIVIEKFNFKKSLLDLGIENNIIETWLKIRKTKKAVNSEIAFNRIKNEIEKSGRAANDCIKFAVEKSWSGFEAEWINKQQQNFNNYGGSQTNKSRAMETGVSGSGYETSPGFD